MATTNRVGTTWHYGNTTSWIVPGTYVYIGTSPPRMGRLTFGGTQGRIDNIGTITGMKFYMDTVNTSLNSGTLYVSTNSAITPENVTASATSFGTWSTPNGTAFWMDVGSFNAANFVSAVGSATTWYVYFTTTSTTDRSWYSPTVYPTMEITYLPGLMHANVGGVWQQGTPYVNIGGVWNIGMAYANVGGVWNIGI